MFSKKHQTNMLFALLVYSMFAILSLMLVLLGAQVYKRVINESDTRNSIRMTLSYVSNKIRAGDEMDKISIKEKNGTPILVISEEFDDVDLFTDEVVRTKIDTLIFFYEGELREMKSPTGGDILDLGLSEKLAAVDNFTFEKINGMYYITSTVGGKDYSMMVSCRSANKGEVTS